ncbi:MAG: hypothetical protein HC848_05085 [Limnobacter sp.]|nr:hypothetical protein [Limnobacter sp.]
MSKPLAYFNYGALGWALGAVAVPIYIQVPFLYSRIFEVPAAWVGAILLFSRIFDAVLDPLVGLWIDKRCGQKTATPCPCSFPFPFASGHVRGVFPPR